MSTTESSLVLFIIAAVSQMIALMSLATMCVCYTLIWRHSSKVKKEVATVGNMTQRNTDKSMVPRLVIIIACYALCILPVISINILNDISTSVPHSILPASCAMFMLISSTTNPVLYTFSSSTFIEKVKALKDKV